VGWGEYHDSDSLSCNNVVNCITFPYSTLDGSGGLVRKAEDVQYVETIHVTMDLSSKGSFILQGRCESIGSDQTGILTLPSIPSEESVEMKDGSRSVPRDDMLGRASNVNQMMTFLRAKHLSALHCLVTKIR